MAVFHYKARGTGGDLIEGDLEAVSMDAVAAQLASGGATPIDINEKIMARNAGEQLRARLGSDRPTVDDLLLFSRQMYALMKAGVPINRAMKSLAESTRNRGLVAALGHVLTDLESGHDLAGSMARHTRVFPQLFVSMVRVGENTGRLDESFYRMSQYLELEKDTRERVKAALRYPIFVIVAIAVAISIINVVVIPAFAKIFEKADVPLPWATQVLLAVSDFSVNWWPEILAAIIAAVIGLRAYVRTAQGRYRWDHWKLRLPVVGDILKRITLARFARSFSVALVSGVPLIPALTVVSRAVDNEYICGHLLNMRGGIERGDTLTRTAAATGIFTPVIIQMLAVGEETGMVDDLLQEVAEYYEREVDYDIKNLSASIEPVMVVGIGIMVLILALGVFLPMWDMASVYMGK